MELQRSQPHPLALNYGETIERVIAQRWIATTGIIFFLGFVAIPHDIALARFFSDGHLPRAIEDVLERAETFAHGIGIAAILIVLYVVDLSRRWAFPRVILATVTAGAAANGFKLLIGRLRPHSADLSTQAADTFTGLLPLFSVGSSHRGCPSAHTTVVFAFAIGLCWLYPRGRYLFITFALLAAMQRLAANAHFLSDVCWGASLGYFIGRGFVCGRLTGQQFDLWELRRYAKRVYSSGKSPEEYQSTQRHRRAA